MFEDYFRGKANVDMQTEQHIEQMAQELHQIRSEMNTLAQQSTSSNQMIGSILLQQQSIQRLLFPIIEDYHVRRATASEQLNANSDQA